MGGVDPGNILRYHHNIRESYHLANESSHSDWLTAKEGVMDVKIQRERERQKNNWFNKQNNNFARASRFFVHFFPVFARLRRENA